MLIHAAEGEIDEKTPACLAAARGPAGADRL
jgi:hypothetical protein